MSALKDHQLFHGRGIGHSDEIAGGIEQESFCHLLIVLKIGKIAI
jgi:hypothetical protein